MKKRRWLCSTGTACPQGCRGGGCLVRQAAAGGWRRRRQQCRSLAARRMGAPARTPASARPVEWAGCLPWREARPPTLLPAPAGRRGAAAWLPACLVADVGCRIDVVRCRTGRRADRAGHCAGSLQRRSRPPGRWRRWVLMPDCNSVSMHCSKAPTSEDGSSHGGLACRPGTRPTRFQAAWHRLNDIGCSLPTSIWHADDSRGPLGAERPAHLRAWPFLWPSL